MKGISKLAAQFTATLALTCAATAYGASHREAPGIASDPCADITDTYLFRSWQHPGNVVMIMNVIPAQEPSSAPNYFNFCDEVRYTFNFDTNADGSAEDVKYEVRFKTEIRGAVNSLKLPLSYVAVPRPITALDGAGSEGLGLRQSYTVTQIKNGVRTNVGAPKMFAVPSNIGPRTMPTYEDLAKQGIYTLNNGGQVFAGQRDETFYIDLGAVFDTVNLRASLPILSAGQDASNSSNPFGNDAFSGFNVSTIAIEVPIAAITGNTNGVIGMYASTDRPKARVLTPTGKSINAGFQQVARMANPLVNELIIGTGQKDLWNALDPDQEAQFLDFYLNSRLATALNIVFKTNFPTTNRKDLVNALLKYPSQPQTGACSAASPCSELLRLNLAVAPTLPENQKRLGVLGGDNAGWPNGRRPNDDITDATLRVVAGALLGPVPALGDGVNFNIGAEGSNLTTNGIYKVFPYLPTPHDGRNRRHIDCGEAGANLCN